MRAGKLRNRIALEAFTDAKDSYGQPIQNWAHQRYLWAEAITGGGTEFYAAQKLHSSTSVVFRIRHTTIDVKNRFKWQGRTYDILNIQPDEGTQRQLLVSCKEVL